jgi:hypothetical protein
MTAVQAMQYSRIPRRLRRLIGGVALVAAIAALGAPTSAQAQALDCNVSVDYSQLQGADYQFLDELEQKIREYLNNNTWTDDRFLEYERINCSMQLIMQEATSLTNFRARLIVASRRPIYNTAQSTPVVRINDTDLRFEYSRGTPLQFNPETFDPLTSVLDFYAYVLLGYDYDTYSELGGTPYFERARRIANLAQGSGGSGWSTVGGDRGRTDLIGELLDSRFEPLREAYYRYHLQGLDLFVEETDTARQNIIGVLESLETLNQNVSRSYALDLFFAAKFQELAAIFVNSPVSNRAYNLLTQIDPSHSSEYNQLVN